MFVCLFFQILIIFGTEIANLMEIGLSSVPLKRIVFQFICEGKTVPTSCKFSLSCRTAEHVMNHFSSQENSFNQRTT